MFGSLSEQNLNFHLSLVGEGMSRSSEATSEHSLSRYEYVLDDLFGSERESSANSPSEEEEEASVSGCGHRKVVLPRIQLVNDFPMSMTNEVFSRLRPCFQIPNNIPIRKANKGEKCYARELNEVGFYDVAFIARLRLPLSHLHCQLADYMGVFVYQIAPNAQRIFKGAEVLWGQLSGGYKSLTLEEFFYYYKPQEIA